eukprot:4255367-Amphidinium_carterae.1
MDPQAYADSSMLACICWIAIYHGAQEAGEKAGSLPAVRSVGPEPISSVYRKEDSQASVFDPGERTVWRKLSASTTHAGRAACNAAVDTSRRSFGMRCPACGDAGGSLKDFASSHKSPTLLAGWRGEAPG